LKRERRQSIFKIDHRFRMRVEQHKKQRAEKGTGGDGVARGCVVLGWNSGSLPSGHRTGAPGTATGERQPRSQCLKGGKGGNVRGGLIFDPVVRKHRDGRRQVGGGSGKEEAMVELYGEHVRENFTTVC